MSLILKGIDMPKKGTNIVLTIYGRDGTYDAKAYPSGVCIKGEAIQIPKGHGRLIDADALETVFKDMAKCEWNQKAFPISWAYAFEDTIDEIHDAPTILDKERE